MRYNNGLNPHFSYTNGEIIIPGDGREDLCCMPSQQTINELTAIFGDNFEEKITKEFLRDFNLPLGYQNNLGNIVSNLIQAYDKHSNETLKDFIINFKNSVICLCKNNENDSEKQNIAFGDSYYDQILTACHSILQNYQNEIF